MVKVAFICEGETEVVLVSSEQFKNYLSTLELENVLTIDANGNGNLLPVNINKHHDACIDKGAEHIIVLCDLENFPCYSERKQKLEAGLNHIHVIAKRKIESWFLADDLSMSALLRKNFHSDYSENIPDPINEINALCKTFLNRGIGISKVKFANKMLNLNFDIQRSAFHPNCPSANYFIKKIKALQI